MYQAAENRYDTMKYKRCGRSGIMLPMVSLGLWQNFGLEKPVSEQREILLSAFDMGITHFDLANNYGFPAPGKAEENFGTVLKSDLLPYRDELIISTKAGYDMWPGPYGNWGSRKYLMSSLDQSLKRMGLEYVDIFYHHRPDPETPLEETMGALADIVKQGKALYAGISNYGEQEAGTGSGGRSVWSVAGTGNRLHLLQPSRSGCFDKPVFKWCSSGFQGCEKGNYHRRALSHRRKA